MAAWRSIQDTVDWIEDHLGEELTVEDLAKIAQLSPYYFQRLFRRLVGKPVMEYVKLRRLARVTNRLIFNHDTILDSSLYYGFANHETFSRAFKEAYGLTPTEFRKVLKPVRHFSKPILTEEGRNVIDYEVKIADLEKMRFLVLPHTITFGDDRDTYGASVRIWEERLRDGSLERLQTICESDTVYGLFCDTYDGITQNASYDLGCLYAGDAPPNYRLITLRPAKYAVVACQIGAALPRTEAVFRSDDIFWQEWLPRTNYRCVIVRDWRQGSALIERYEPMDINAGAFTVTRWYPIAAG